MPTSLINQLKTFAEKDHFMDMSEEIRYIIKQKYIEHQDPYKAEISRLKDDLKNEIVKRTNTEREFLIDELRKLLDDIKQKEGEKK